MIVFNTFNTGKRYGGIPKIDILIWTASLIRYRSFRYTTKLFCTKSEIEFLKKWHLYDLYDVIDTDLFEKSEMIDKVDGKHFWSTRKIEAMHYQLNVLHEDAVYSDTDIIMRKPFDLSKDVLVWCPEDESTNNFSIYVPWRNLSKPEGYVMQEYMLKTKDAYNGGIWHFKDPSIFDHYRTEYYKFAIGNPCKIKLHKSRGDDVEDLITNNNVWACNGEQRILKAVLNLHCQKVAFVMNERKKGWSKEASHYFHYRIAWRYIDDKDSIPSPDAIPMLNMTVLECMLTIAAYCKMIKDDSLLNFWEHQRFLRDWRKINFKEKAWQIFKYE